jgi:hypothetical protein
VEVACFSFVVVEVCLDFHSLEVVEYQTMEEEEDHSLVEEVCLPLVVVKILNLISWHLEVEVEVQLLMVKLLVVEEVDYYQYSYLEEVEFLLLEGEVGVEEY